MIRGRKHLWCGRINWNNDDDCICPVSLWSSDFAAQHPDAFVFIDVVFDNEQLEKIAKKIKNIFEQMGLGKITIDYDPEYDTDDELCNIEAIIIDGWVSVRNSLHPYFFDVDILDDGSLNIETNINTYKTIKKVARLVFNNLLKHALEE